MSAAQLKQNPSGLLDRVEGGESFVVTRYNRAMSQLVPIAKSRRPPTGQEVMALLGAAPVDAGWAPEVNRDREQFDGEIERR